MICPRLNLLCSLPHSHKYSPICTYFIVLSFIINTKLMFKGDSQGIHAEGLLYFGLFNPFHGSLLPLLSHTHFFNSFQYLSLYSLPSKILCFMILLMLLSFSFPLSQTCSTSEFVYNHACFCVHVYHWVYLLRMRDNM
jgi:hypothetical protein